MAIVICKGTILKQTISSSLTAVAQIISLNVADSQSQTFDSTTLDGGVWKTKAQTGYSEAGDVSGELFFDPALAGHQAITDLLHTPADCVWTITHADTGNTVQTFTGAGVSFGSAFDMNDGLKASFSIAVDGSAGWAT